MALSGYCACGCGAKTAIAKRNFRRLGIKKGEPFSFVRGHHARLRQATRLSTAVGGREQARRLWPDPLGECEECGSAEAIDRHHKDGDPTNNARSNVAFLCRRCHMKIDGRLEWVRQGGYKWTTETAYRDGGRAPDVPRDAHGRYVRSADTAWQ